MPSYCTFLDSLLHYSDALIHIEIPHLRLQSIRILPCKPIQVVLHVTLPEVLFKCKYIINLNIYKSTVSLPSVDFVILSRK